MTFSLGNLLFDQRGARSSSALIELRVFEQGTYATRLIPAPNLYEFAVEVHARVGGRIEAPGDGSPIARLERRRIVTWRGPFELVSNA